MPDTAAPLSAVQLAEADLIGDEFTAVVDAAPGYLLAALAPVVRFVRSEGITLARLSATGYEHIPPAALPALVIAAAAVGRSGAASPFTRRLLALADALEVL